MSTAEVDTPEQKTRQQTEQPEQPEPLVREASVELAPGGDGRTLISRLVPYHEEAHVDDGSGPYVEMFLPGAFNRQMRAADKIKAVLNYRHRQGVADVVGHANSIEDRPDGLHGELRVHRTAAGDTALELIEGGVNKLSVEFESRGHRLVNGVVVRHSARLLGVALVPEGAYKSAQVLAVREQEPHLSLLREELGKPLDPALAVLLRAVGLEVPERLLPRKVCIPDACAYDNVDCPNGCNIEAE